MCLHFYFFFSFLLRFVNPIGVIPVSPAGFCFLSNCDVDEDHESVVPSPAWGAVWQDSRWPIALPRSLAPCSFYGLSHLCVCLHVWYNIVLTWSMSMKSHLHPPPQLAICSAPEKTAVFSLAQTLLLMLRFSAATFMSCDCYFGQRETERDRKSKVRGIWLCTELEVDMNIKEFYSCEQVMLPVAFSSHWQVVSFGVCVCVCICLPSHGYRFGCEQHSSGVHWLVCNIQPTLCLYMCFSRLTPPYQTVAVCLCYLTLMTSHPFKQGLGGGVCVPRLCRLEQHTRRLHFTADLVEETQKMKYWNVQSTLSPEGFIEQKLLRQPTAFLCSCGV